jgi:hypothetical protein
VFKKGGKMRRDEKWQMGGTGNRSSKGNKIPRRGIG